MASTKGKRRSFEKYRLRQHQMEKRSAPARHSRRREAEQRRLYNYMGSSPVTDSLTAQRRDYLFEILLHPDVRSAKSFGITWTPNCSWAKGPCIKPFARIFDRFVGTAWSVRVVDNIDGSGTPGWLFERS